MSAGPELMPRTLVGRVFRRKPLAVAIGLAVLLALPPVAIAIGDPFLIKLATRMLIYALAAAALDVIVGYGAMVSLAHGAFFGLGAYVVGILSHHVAERSAVLGITGAWSGSTSALVQWPLAIGVVGLFALVIGALSLRTSGVYFIMITLAFAQMLYYFMVGLPNYGGEDGLNIWQRTTLPGLDLADPTTFYYVCLALLVAFIAASKALLASRFGRVVRGVKANERRLTALGIEPYPFKLAAFVYSACGAGLAGALIAHHTEFVGPGFMKWTISGELLVMVILGGMGTLFGPVLGALALLVLEEVLTKLTEHWMLVLGPILVLAVLFFRGGLWGLIAGREARDG
ncbi:MAG: branched-chain amino acid ABC transporter permease [Hyphomicrobiaceae bacterium]